MCATDAQLARTALARVIEAWGDPRGYAFHGEAHEGAIEVRIVRSAQPRVTLDLALNSTALDPAQTDPAILRDEIARRRNRLEVEVAELRAAA